MDLLERLHPLIGEPGLSAAVYTQTTDVEIEVNGLMTYDRAVIKMDEKAIRDAADNLHGPPPKVIAVVPTSQQKAQTWRYTLEKPSDGWEKPGFDATAWKEGEAGFGTRGTPGAVVRTEWNTPDIWLRREVEVKASQPSKVQLVIHHDEDAEIYINGELSGAAQRVYDRVYAHADLGKGADRLERRQKHDRHPLPADRRRAIHRRWPCGCRTGASECGANLVTRSVSEAESNGTSLTRQATIPSET